jgi:hypothetical protein
MKQTYAKPEKKQRLPVWEVDPGPWTKWGELDQLNQYRYFDGLPELPGNDELDDAVIAAGFTDCHGVFYKRAGKEAAYAGPRIAQEVAS